MLKTVVVETWTVRIDGRPIADYSVYAMADAHAAIVGGTVTRHTRKRTVL